MDRDCDNGRAPVPHLCTQVVVLFSPDCRPNSSACTTLGPGNKKIQKEMQYARRKQNDFHIHYGIAAFYFIPEHKRLMLVLENPAKSALWEREV